MHDKCSHRAGPWVRGDTRDGEGTLQGKRHERLGLCKAARARLARLQAALGGLCVVEDRAGVFGCPCYPSVCM